MTDTPVIPPCPHCQHDESRVLETRLSIDHPGQVRRRRECLKCALRFTTFAPFEALEPFEFVDVASSSQAAKH